MCGGRSVRLGKRCRLGALLPSSQRAMGRANLLPPLARDLHRERRWKLSLNQESTRFSRLPEATGRARARLRAGAFW